MTMAILVASDIINIPQKNSIFRRISIIYNVDIKPIIYPKLFKNFIIPVDIIYSFHIIINLSIFLLFKPDYLYNSGFIFEVELQYL